MLFKSNLPQSVGAEFTMIQLCFQEGMTVQAIQKSNLILYTLVKKLQKYLMPRKPSRYHVHKMTCKTRTAQLLYRLVSNIQYCKTECKKSWNFSPSVQCHICMNGKQNQETSEKIKFLQDFQQDLTLTMGNANLSMHDMLQSHELKSIFPLLTDPS